MREHARDHGVLLGHELDDELTAEGSEEPGDGAEGHVVADGQVVDQRVGAMPKPEVLKMLEPHLAKVVS